MIPQLLREARPTARKAHCCSLCTGPISSGETYSRQTLVYDGQVYDWLECSACEADEIITLVAEWTREDGIDPEIAHEWATETARYPRCPADSLAAKRYLDRANRSADVERIKQEQRDQQERSS